MSKFVVNGGKKLYGEVDIQNEISNLKVKFKYNFSGKDLEDFKVYLKYINIWKKEYIMQLLLYLKIHITIK